jgi:hypothetical protein
MAKSMRSEQTSGASHEKIVMAPSDTETEPSEAPFGMKQGRAGRIALPVRCAGSTSWQRFYCTALVGKRLRKRLDKLSGLKALYLYILWKSSIYCGRVPPRCIYAFQPRYALTLGERERPMSYYLLWGALYIGKGLAYIIYGMMR